MDHQHHQRRFLHPIHRITTSQTNSSNANGLNSKQSIIDSNRSRSRLPSFEGRYRNGVPWRRLPLTPICNPEEDRRSTPTEPIRETSVFQDGNNEKDLHHDPTQRLHDQHQLTRRVLAYKHTPSTSEVSPIHLERPMLPVQNTSFRTVTISSSIHQNTEASSKLGSSPGNQIDRLPGRFNGDCNIQDTSTDTYTKCIRQTTTVRLLDQVLQMSSNAFSTYRTLRIHD
jgi:hypothetical protein